MTAFGAEFGCKWVLTGPDSTRVVFNDASDEDYVGELSPDTSGLASPDVAENVTPHVEADGAIQGAQYYAKRTLRLAGTVVAEGVKDRNTKVGKLLAASNAMRADATLVGYPEGGPEAGVELKVRRSQPARITGAFTKTFTIELSAAAPFWKSKATASVTRKTGFYQKNEGAGEHLNHGVAYVAYEPVSGYLFMNINITTDGPSLARMKPLVDEEPEVVAEELSNLVGISADETYVYYGNGKYIGRIKHDGSGDEPEWKEGGSGGGSVTATACNSTHVYYTDTLSDGLYRMTVGGAENELLVESASIAYGIDLDETYVYFSRAGNIGRAKLDGSEAELTFCEGPYNAYQVKVTSEYLYWMDNTKGTIGRASASEGGAGNVYWHDIGGASSPKWFEVIGTYFYIPYLYSNPQKVAVKMDSVAVTNAGSGTAYPILYVEDISAEVFGDSGHCRVENTTTGEAIRFKKAVEGFNYLEINMEQRTLKLNGETAVAWDEYIFDSQAYLSTAWGLIPGTNHITTQHCHAHVEWVDSWA